ncbi:MAG: hypothetical protein AB1551_05720 [Actinomycetota bacterium]
MQVFVGICLIVAGSAVGLAVGLAWWARLAAVRALMLEAACGAAVGAGALLVQKGPGWGDFALTMAALLALTPLHWRLLRGPSGGDVGS